MIRKDNLESMIKAIGYIASSRTKVFEKNTFNMIAKLKLISTKMVLSIILKTKE